MTDRMLKETVARDVNDCLHASICGASIGASFGVCAYSFLSHATTQQVCSALIKAAIIWICWSILMVSLGAVVHWWSIK